MNELPPPQSSAFMGLFEAYVLLQEQIAPPPTASQENQKTSRKVVRTQEWLSSPAAFIELKYHITFLFKEAHESITLKYRWFLLFDHGGRWKALLKRRREYSWEPNEHSGSHAGAQLLWFVN